MLQKIRHCLRNKGIGDCLLCLIGIGGLCGKAVGDKDQAVLNIRKCDLRFVFVVFAVRLQVLVHGIHKGGLECLFRRSAVLQKAGIVIIFNYIDRV